MKRLGNILKTVSFSEERRQLIFGRPWRENVMTMIQTFHVPTYREQAFVELKTNELILSASLDVVQSILSYNIRVSFDMNVKTIVDQ